jgi:predicted transcriptional regulator
MAMVTLRLDDETNARLTKAAQNSGQSKSQIIKSLIAQNLDMIESLPPLSEYMAEYKKFKAEGGRMLTLDELE